MKTFYLYIFLILSLFAHATDAEDENIRVTYRTLGWDIQGTFASPQAVNGATFNVYMSQFGDSQTYIGPKKLQLVHSRAYSSSSADSNMMDDDNEAVATHPVSKTSQSVPVIADIHIPEGARRILLIFTRIFNVSGKSSLLTAVVDDSLTLTDKRNIHFYNLTADELFVNAFGITKTVQAGSQVVWKLEENEDQSSLAIAVKNPEAKIIYSSRLRLRDEQRMVFFARKDPQATISNPNKLIVTTLIEELQKENKASPHEENQVLSMN
ncbi:hypothetical protein ACWPKS_02280 [Coraliomargarita sp. W4R72]